eukprot:c12751_g1_i6.p1 GENE.c12751_g1_i6~~c12751_g1_i6.p1  ORF type:complete len:221 (+),score=44.84 c12751_g1_i6:224-886(+)
MRGVRLCSLSLQSCSVCGFLLFVDLADFSGLEVLVLESSHPKLDLAAQNKLKQLLCNCPALVSFQLSDSISRGDTVTWLEHSIARMPQLTSLNLHANYLGAGRVSQISSALASASPSLVVLDLRSNSLGFEGISHLAPLIDSMHQLVDLRLSNNCLGVEGAREVSECVAKMRHLTALDLWTNSLGTEGIRALAPSLCQLTHLTSLDLSSCDMRYAIFVMC